MNKLFLAAALFPCTILAQGSLTPPGPPAPSMKTLAQIEPRTPISSLPFTINQSGSYYVTTNLIGVSGQNGIIVQTRNVTIDLNGFGILGPNSCVGGVPGGNCTHSGGGAGIFADAGAPNGGALGL